MAAKREVALSVIDQELQTHDLTGNTAVEIKERMSQFIEGLDQLKSKAFSIVVTEEDQVDLMKEAGDLLREYKKRRLAHEKVKKEMKDGAIRYNRAIDAIWNFTRDSLLEAEAHLKEQRDFVKVREELRKQKLGEKRFKEISKYTEDASPEQLAEMTEEIYQTVLIGAKSNFEKRQEEDRLAAEEEGRRQNHERMVRQRLERLMALGVRREVSKYMYHDILVMIHEDLESFPDEDFESALKEGEIKVKAKAKEIAADRKRLVALQKEKEAQERAEAEQAKQQEENSDKKNLILFAESILGLALPTMKTPEGKKILDTAISDLNAISITIETEAKKL